MASNIETKIDRIATAVTSALSALTAKGVTVPEGANVESLAALIASIEAGGGGGEIEIGNFTTVRYGSFRPSEDISTYTIDLGYAGSAGSGTVEVFFLYRDIDSTYDGTSTKNSFVCCIYSTNIKSGTVTASGLPLSRYYNSSGSLATSTAVVSRYNSQSSDTTPRTITINAVTANSNCRLTSGSTYCWIALRRTA